MSIPIRRALNYRPNRRLFLVILVLPLAGVMHASADELPTPLTLAAASAPNNETIPAPNSDFVAEFDEVLDPEQYFNAPVDSDPRYHARFRGGATYFDVPVESLVGGSYAFDMAVPLFRSVGAYGSGSLNHFSSGTQFLGTVGLFKQASICPTDFYNRISYGILFDQFTDTRFDELYLTQFRFLLSLSLSGDTAIGVRHAEPADKDRRVLMSGPFGPVGATFRTSQTTEAFLARRFGCTMVTGALGYRDDLNAIIYSTEIRRRMSGRLTTVVEITYEDAGLWATMVGFELQLGRSGRCCDCYDRDAGNLMQTVSLASRDVVRGQGLGGGFFGNILSSLFGDGNTGGTGPWNNPSMGGIFNYDASDFWERVFFDFDTPMMGAPPFEETGNGEDDDVDPPPLQEEEGE